MKRRTVLVGSSTVLLASGCLSPTQSASSPTEDHSKPDDIPTESPGSQTSTPEDTSTEQAGDPFPEIGCPSFRESDITVCAHTGDSPIILQPASPTYRVIQGNSTVETLNLTLSNASEHSFGFNPHDWRVYRYTGDGWIKVAPEEVVEPWTEVSPNGQYEYELTTQQHPSPPNGPHQIDVDLSSGVYAVSIVGNWDKGRSAKLVECVALVEVTVTSEDT